MSSCDEASIDFWIQDSVYNFHLSQDQIDHIKDLLGGGLCQTIENAVMEYDEFSQSWRDYRNTLWIYVPDSTDTAIDVYLASLKDE